ncbi:gamma-glutamyltransferase [Anaeromyxobacter sp. SG64]|uniref:gamma-glutamyltransferase n=1 Tax=Anaeromyxobacter sp. SG64 TaxID=2925409 RepID=UPI001F56542D|nr:gamma-glutamyltransferase [Anaeromyxobacter sp. SG64]
MPVLLAIVLSATAVSSRGAVATAHPLASEVAADVLRRGGNAADAAVAAALALAVVEPQSSGIGGGGFALVYDAREKKVHALDFREVAPGAATPDLFAARGGAPATPSRSLDGGLAVAVPGAVKGYAELARRFGTRSFAALAAPAARLAERGFPASPSYSDAARARLACLAARPAAARELLVAGADGRPAAPAPGERIVRRDLARTLRLLGRDPAAFYRGPLAERIARAARDDGGVLAASDLARYRVRDRAPVEGSYRGYRIVSMGLPSAGGAIVIGLLQALEREAPREGGYRPVRFLHAMAEAEKRLFAKRAALGDPDFVPGAAGVVEEMVSPAYAARLSAELGERARPVAADTPPRDEGKHTTHLSVVDAEGNAVAITTTVNYLFGACVVVPGTGILLNDEMDDFDAAAGAPNAYGLVGTGANAPAAGKTPLSSMAPTLVFAPGGALWLVVGAPGGSTIPTTVAQAISHLVDDGMSLEQALAAPRLHHQWQPDALRVEPNALEAETARALAARGHRLQVAERPWGNAQAVRRRPDGRWEAASDPRYDGAPSAP